MNITINVPTDKERGAFTCTEMCIYKQEPRRGKGKNTHRIPLTPIKHNFSYLGYSSNFGIGGSVTGATLVQHSPFLSFLRIMIHKDDLILDDLI